MKRMLTFVLCLAVLLCATAVWASAEPETLPAHGNHCACSGSFISGGAKDCMTAYHNTNQQWYAWTSNNSLPAHNSTGLDANGNPVAGARFYYLTEDVVLSEKYTSTGRTYICLHGHNITAPKGINIVGDFFIVDCTASFDSDGYLTNGNGITGPITSNSHLRLFGVNLKGGSQTALTVPNSKTLTAKYCKFSGNKADAGAGMSIQGGTVNLSKCYFTGNDATGNGGAIDIKSGSPTVNIDDCKFSGNTAGGKGGALSVTNGATPKLTVTDSTFSGNSAAAGGAVYSSKSASATTNLAFTDCTFSNNAASGNGGAIDMEFSNAQPVVLTDCTFSGNKATKDGGVVYLNAGNLTISGGTYKNNQAANGGVACIASIVTGNVTLKDGAVFEGNTAGTGAVVCQFGGPLTVSGVTMKDNTATSGGGALFLNGGTCAITDSAFTGNSAAFRGGAICLPEGSKAALTMTGGQMKGNKVTDANSYGGGALFVYDGSAALTNVTITENTNQGRHGSAINIGETNTKAASVSLTDCTITDNTNKSKDNRAGVTVHNPKCSLTISGKTVISGNINEGIERNVFLRQAGTKITVGQLAEGSSLSVYTLQHNMDAYSISYPVEDPDDFLTKSGDWTTWDAGWISYDNNGEKVYYSTAKAFYFQVKEADHFHCLCSGGGVGCTHDSVGWVAWERADSLPVNAGNYYLTTDVQLKTAAIMTGTVKVNLCLNGHSITASSSKEKWVYSLNYDAVLTLSDCAGTGKLTGGTDGCIRLRKTEGAKGTTFNLYDGIITGNTRQYAGAGIAMYANGTFNMYGGEISNNKGQGCGGGISAENNCKVNIYAGTISGNTAGTYGGAMNLANQSALTMSGGTISGNTAGTEGGAIYAAGGEMTLTGGEIKNNTAASHGGGIWTSRSVVSFGGTNFTGNTGKSGGAIYLYNAQLTMTKGRVTENKSTDKNSGGAGIRLVGGGSFLLEGGVIMNNSTPGNGGGVNLQENVVMTMTGGEIRQNKAQMGGGVFAIHKCSMVFEGGIVTNNKSVGTGGGIYIANDCSYKMYSDATVSGNQGANGGGLALFKATATINGGTVKNNIAKDNGGGIQVQNSTLYLYGGTVSGNTCTQMGGGIYGTGTSTRLRMAGGRVTGNKAEKGSGILTIGGCSMTMSGGSVTGNTATMTGGLFIANDCSMTMSGGTISGNKAPAGSGLHLHKADVTMTDGLIKDNVASDKNGGGAGVRVNQNSTFLMSGGTIEGNTTAGMGGGIFAQNESKIVLQGGVIRGNKAEKGGAILLHTATMEFIDGQILENTATSNCGGLFVANNSILTMSGGLISGNVAPNAGGMDHYKGQTTMTGGVIKGNSATKDGANGGGGVRVPATSTFNMQGGVIEENTSAGMGGGLFLNGRSNVTLSGGSVINNTAVYGAGIHCSGHTALAIGEILVQGNTASDSGGGIYISAGSTTLNGATITENRAAVSGGGIAFRGYGIMNIVSGDITNNTTDGNGGGIHSERSHLIIRGGNVTGNTAGGLGGGIYNNGYGMPQVQEDSFPLSGAYIANNTANAGGGIYLVWINANISNCVVENNTAVNGGGLNHGTTQLTYLNNVEFKGNTASENGGALYFHRGSDTYMDGCKLLNNKAGKDGGALWLDSKMAMTNMTVSGNTAGGIGGGVYLAPVKYDGHSYISGTVKIGGQMIVSDNSGKGDLYISEGTLVNMTAEGLTGESKVGVVLENGLLTQTVYGLYGYEGGDGSYTMTPGTRSIDEPESKPFGGDEKVAFEITPTVAIIIAAVAVVLLGGGAAALILLRKKKKPANVVEGGAQ